MFGMTTKQPENHFMGQKFDDSTFIGAEILISFIITAEQGLFKFISALSPSEILKIC